MKGYIHNIPAGELDSNTALPYLHYRQIFFLYQYLHQPLSYFFCQYQQQDDRGCVIAEWQDSCSGQDYQMLLIPGFSFVYSYSKAKWEFNLKNMILPAWDFFDDIIKGIR